METPHILTWITSSQQRIFSDMMPTPDYKAASVLRNEPFSFCLAYRSDYKKSDTEKIPDLPISVRATCEGLPVAAYKLGFVPVHAYDCEDGGESRGMCPDILLPRSADPTIVTGDCRLTYYEQNEPNQLNVSCISTNGLLFTVNEDGSMLAAGDYRVEIVVTDLRDATEIARHTLDLHVIDACLPENDLIYTNWMHYDCIADYHGVKLYGNAYFQVLARYVKNAVRHGMTTLLLPAFTPPLDTCEGEERTNVQLVKIYEENGTYRFDFSLLARFVRLVRRCGIQRFEHSHLFSQWGAYSAPNVYVQRDGSSVLRFGWKTDASGEEYASFLRAYIPAFLAEAERLGIADTLLFHVSDEPKINQIDSYMRAINLVRELIGDRLIGDALSSYEFYSEAGVRCPIVATHSIQPFDGNCDELMLYYTGGTPDVLLSNRLLFSSPQKTRILGLHLFRYRAKGFLHWGYNYYYGRMSHGFFDPKVDPYGYRNIPGASFLVYPAQNGEVLPSLREKQMCDAVNDRRALKLLESKIGYDAVLAL